MPDPMIADFYGNFSLALGNINLYGTSRLTVFNGIVKEVPHCLLKQSGVGLYHNLIAYNARSPVCGAHGPLSHMRQ